MAAGRTPRDLERTRAQWIHRGTTRPSWALEPAPGQESVWDYPRPPRLERDHRLIRVALGTTLIAESRHAVRVLETASPPAFYIPREHVRTELLTWGSGASHCEWKGDASYWSLRTESGAIDNVGWSYEHPYEEFKAIRAFLSFYPGKVECYVDAEPVQPQPGGFYGGWITSEVVGPFKGEPGSGTW